VAERPHRVPQSRPPATDGGRKTPSRVVLPSPANDNPAPPLLRALRFAAGAAAIIAIGLVAVWISR